MNSKETKNNPQLEELENPFYFFFLLLFQLNTTVTSSLAHPVHNMR